VILLQLLFPRAVQAIHRRPAKKNEPREKSGRIACLTRFSSKPDLHIHTWESPFPSAEETAHPF
jgi:hypothetical protein